VKILTTTSTVSMLALLAGCAGVTTAVESHGTLPAAHQPPASYRLARTPAQQALPGDAPDEAVLRDALAQHGFAPAAGDGARAQYLVSAAWSTRPADIDVGSNGCKHDCTPTTGPGFPWFGTPYLHELTLRVFALPGGEPVYKATVVKRDRQADARQAAPYLVSGALAQLPAHGGPQWRVKLQQAQAGALPGVVSVAPLGQQP